jgi:hypothetical protein
VLGFRAPPAEGKEPVVPVLGLRAPGPEGADVGGGGFGLGVAPGAPSGELALPKVPAVATPGDAVVIPPVVSVEDPAVVVVVAPDPAAAGAVGAGSVST